MKAFFAVQARRINALSLRERAIMFFSLAGALVAAADALVLSPRIAQQKALTEQLHQRSAELDAMRGAIAGGPGSLETAPTRLARQLRETRAEQRKIDAELTHHLANDAQNMRLPELLGRVLRRHERLTLLRLATAEKPPAAAGALSEGMALLRLAAGDKLADKLADKPGDKPAAIAWPSSVPLQGVDVGLRGSYSDLAQYVAEAEREMPGLRWGVLSITTETVAADGGPQTGATPELSARVFLLGDIK